MITALDFYYVMTVMVPLYVAMILAYGSVKWWKIFAPYRCSCINRFVALFAVPLLSFHFISTNDPLLSLLSFRKTNTIWSGEEEVADTECFFLQFFIFRRLLFFSSFNTLT